MTETTTLIFFKFFDRVKFSANSADSADSKINIKYFNLIYPFHELTLAAGPYPLLHVVTSVVKLNTVWLLV